MHISVLLQETINGLNLKDNSTVVDCTLGYGGHSSEILKKIPNGKLYAFDQDEDAIFYSHKRLSEISNNFEIIKSNFVNLKEKLNEKGIDKVDGIIYDLGVSSPQLDEDERGFSFHKDSKLDMRMDKTQKLSAFNVVNEYSYNDLVRIFRDYGEEKWAVRVADFIVRERDKKPILTTFELVDVIKAAIPLGARSEGGHPAKRIFQAIRIEVNGEIESLRNAIVDAIDVLAPGGRICIISFHSLEDRIVKDVFNEAAKGCKCPPDFPKCVCNNKKDVNILSKKPIISTDVELDNNNRAHSAKLRVAEKI